jgi:response regulator RpfG family c-di-GMP phosphodiesterase
MVEFRDGQLYLDKSITLLYVEDTPDDAALFMAYLKRADKNGKIKVVHYTNGIDAAVHAATEPIDLAILDEEVPGLMGHEINGVIRSFPHGRHVPVRYATNVQEYARLPKDRRSEKLTQAFPKEELRRNIGSIIYEALRDAA